MSMLSVVQLTSWRPGWRSKATTAAVNKSLRRSMSGVKSKSDFLDWSSIRVDREPLCKAGFLMRALIKRWERRGKVSTMAKATMLIAKLKSLEKLLFLLV